MTKTELKQALRAAKKFKVPDPETVEGFKSFLALSQVRSGSYRGKGVRKYFEFSRRGKRLAAALAEYDAALMEYRNFLQCEIQPAAGKAGVSA